jgi:hypothetical protein
LHPGGASAVLVVNGHGLGWPNVLWDELPERVAPADNNAWSEGVDAMFQVGFHARAGTANGFVSHTMVPGLRVAVDGAPVTECHIWARLAGLPVLGIAGDAALGGQPDGFLGGTPFLAVKRSASRTASTPVHQNPDGSLNALREFALALWAGPPRPAAFRPVPVHLRGVHGPALEHLGRGATRSHSCQRGRALQGGRGLGPRRPAGLEAAMGAALQPLFAAQADLDLSSEAAMNQQDPGKLQRFRGFFEDWVQADEPTWQA